MRGMLIPSEIIPTGDEAIPALGWFRPNHPIIPAARQACKLLCDKRAPFVDQEKKLLVLAAVDERHDVRMVHPKSERPGTSWEPFNAGKVVDRYIRAKCN